MTMIGNNILNQIVNGQGVYAPNEILNLMPEMLEKTLLHSEGKIRDGMDIAIISILTNEKKLILNYAGAMNPLYYVQNNEFFEIKADKTPIGGQMKEGFVYKNNEVSLYEVSENGEKLKLETTIYLCSDGFQDQFGGVKNKKFMVRNLRNLLLENTNKPMKAQKEIIERTFDDWKSDAKQTDDVLILAFKI
jgi:serine phosphatase RsbU (regulator of sigma subunit)